MRTQEWHNERRGYIGGSDANIIMSGDLKALVNLWMVKTGQKDGDDLSWVLPVQIGRITEDLNVSFYQKETGLIVTDRNGHFTHKDLPFMRCEVDGLIMPGGLKHERCVFEAKHISGYRDLEDAVQAYMPQLHHNMAVTEFKRSVISIFRDTTQHKIVEVEYDPFYGAELMKAEKEFWDCVQSKTPPGDAVSVAAPLPVDKTKIVDMKESNSWADNAAKWIKNLDANKAFDKAAKDIKTLMPADAGKAHGHGIVVSRDKAGKLSIKAGEI